MSYFHRFPLVSEFFRSFLKESAGGRLGLRLVNWGRGYGIIGSVIRETDRTAEELQGLFKVVRSVVLSRFSA